MSKCVSTYVKMNDPKKCFFLQIGWSYGSMKKIAALGLEMSCHNMREEQQFSDLKIGCVNLK